MARFNLQEKITKIADSPQAFFWLLQGLFWLSVALISVFTLTLWYGELTLVHVNHTFLQSLTGALCSMPLYWVFMRCWDDDILPRVSIIILSVLIIAIIWTFIRVYLYVGLTGFAAVWGDFGGWSFGSIFIYFCWSGFFHGIRYNMLLKHEHKIMLRKDAQARIEQLKRLQAQSEARDAMIKMLRYQLNPHFLCNTLNAINSLIEYGVSDKAQRMTVQLSKFLRYSLDNNPDTKISLATEIKALELYLDIEKTRFGERLQLDFNIAGAAKFALIPSLLLQPLIENSMKHVIAKSEEGGTISLNADIDENKLTIELSDTGADVDGNVISNLEERGVGLRNVEERLKVLYIEDYEYILDISETGGLKTIIKLPFELDGDDESQALAANYKAIEVG